MDAFPLKPLTKAGIPGALEMAQRYRLLGEPGVAVSICHDVLLADPGQCECQVLLLLALTDLFERDRGDRYEEALKLAQSLGDPYERAYYTGIVYERRAKALHRRRAPGAGEVAYEWFRRAMASFEEAERLRPAGDDNAILRWNSCARHLSEHADLRPDTDAVPPISGD